jgi:hypothetical protein
MTTQRREFTREIIPDLMALLSDGGERDWIKDAACRGMDTSMWYPEKGDQKSHKLATETCARCKVRDECADYGSFEQYGIWGGMNLKERQATRNGR